MNRFFAHRHVPLYQPRRSIFTSYPSLQQQQQQQQQSKAAKTKSFMKKYGYAGIGVYLTLGAIDLAATMAVISVKGAQQVKEAENYVIGKMKNWIGLKHTPTDASHLSDEKPSFTTLFVVAYGIHKTILLPFRLSLTAAITPAVVRRLQTWGWIQRKINK
ncbi:hypothetical protein RMATCC62417_06128 [Rhizopus microsporus]|nr:hypothetical protein RMATCC62417_06128 [Rhizopus microsporus]